MYVEYFFFFDFVFEHIIGWKKKENVNVLHRSIFE